MKRKIYIAIAVSLIFSVIYGKNDIPIELEKKKIKLDRKKDEENNKKKNKLGKKITRSKNLNDKPLKDKSKLRLPPTIINIEDLSEMNLMRSRDKQNLIPEIDRNKTPYYSVPGESDNDFKHNLVKKTRKHIKKSLSSFELTYGSFDSLSAYLSTGQEYKKMFYQVSYIRKRTEGFNKNGSRVPNSLTGVDDLQIDFGWNHNQFEASANLKFYQNQTGLQTNTNFSQLRKNGLSLLIKSSYIFNSVANMKFNLECGRGRFVLDNAGGQDAVENYLINSDLSFLFSWHNRSYLNLGLSVLVEDFNSEFNSDSKQKNLKLFAEAGFSIASFVNLTFKADLNIESFSDPLFNPLVRMVFRISRRIILFGEFEREFKYVGFEDSIIELPYSIYNPNEKPILGYKYGGGLKLNLFHNFLIQGTIFRKDYDTYYIIVSDNNGLYKYQETSAAMIVGAVELKIHVNKYFDFKIEYIHRIVDDNDLPYIPKIRLRGHFEFKFPQTGTAIGVWSDFESERNNGDLEPYVLFNLRLKQRFTDNFYGVVRILNLLNSGYKLRENYLESGITIHAGVNWKF